LIHEKSTIINTNMGLDELLEAYSERISSRIAGEYKAFKFFGADIRTKIGKKKKVNYY
jgi:DNA replication protein DnaC